MIELTRNQLSFSFPEVHADAKLSIEFQRTLRIPDDGRDYPLPPGLGAFPLRHVDDFANKVPPRWIEHGGVMFPMYQSEAMWLNFTGHYVGNRDANYPFAIKVATGKINAVTGKTWHEGLGKYVQDYMVSTLQPWLDGYCVEKGLIRQFVAMPLGDGYSAEEQITGAADHGGLQVVVYPMKRSVFEKRFPEREQVVSCMMDDVWDKEIADELCDASCDMGLAPGGRMRQEIYDDPFDLNDWDVENGSRCFVHLCNSLVWRSITGEEPPTTPPTSREYTNAGLPWFEYYNDGATAVQGSTILKKLKSVLTKGKEKRASPLPENESVSVTNVVELRKGLRKNQVREGAF